MVLGFGSVLMLFEQPHDIFGRTALENFNVVLDDVWEFVCWDISIHVRDIKRCEFYVIDITNMCTNIPTDKLPNIIQNLCSIKHINPTTQSEILHLCSFVINKNYFQFNDSYFIQKLV